jgi:quinol monooxygenase YgiN
MIVINAIVRAREGFGDECAAEFERMMASRAGEEGNLAWVVTRSVNDPNEFHFFEMYRDSDALSEHLRATKDDPSRAFLADKVVGRPEATLSTWVVGSWKPDEVAASVSAA